MPTRRDLAPRAYDPYQDAERRRTRRQLQKYLDWLKLSNPASAGTIPHGFIGEVSVPWKTPAGVDSPGSTKDSYRWVPMMAEFLDQCRRNNIWVTYWVASWWYSEWFEPVWFGGGGSPPFGIARHVANLLQKHFTHWPGSNDLAYSMPQIGMALDQLTAGSAIRNAATRDGFDDFQWQLSDTGFLDYLRGKGVQLLRMTHSWSRLQRDPGAAFATSAPDLQSLFTTEMTNLNARGFKVILDTNHGHLHYNWWDGANYQAEYPGGANVSIDNLEDYWVKLPTLVQANTPGWGDCVVAYEISNEPASAFGTRPSAGCQRTSTLNDWNDGTVQGFSTEETITGSANDTTLKRSGAGSWKFSRAFAAGFDQVRIRRNSAPAVDASNVAFGASVYLDPAATGNEWWASVFAYSAGFTSYGETFYRLRKGQWNYIAGAPLNTVTGNRVLGDSTGGIGDLGIEIFCSDTPGGGQTVQINVDDFYRGAYNEDSNVELCMQRALTAIRTVDTTRAVVVGGNGFENVDAYPAHHPAGPWVYDPANKLFISGHEYLNYDGSGDYSIYTYEQEINNARNDGF